MEYILAIIIVSYKSDNLTIKYVKEEVSKIEASHITIIVNNDATEKSDRNLAESLNGEIVYDTDKEIKNTTLNCFIISNSLNSGFARGNNLGALFAQKHFCPKYLLFSNNDIEYETYNVVDVLTKKLEQAPNIGMIGPQIVGLDGKKQSPRPYYGFWEEMLFVNLLTPILTDRQKNKFFQFDIAEKASEGVYQFISGAFFIMPSDVFFSCGMMDDNTFLYAEELILSERLKKIQKQVYYYPAVKVIHANRQTTTKYMDNSKNAEVIFNSLCYYYKTYRDISNFQIKTLKLLLAIKRCLKKSID